MAAPAVPTPGMSIESAPSVELLILTCRSGDCVEQWSPEPITKDGRQVVALSIEVCPACGSSAWEVTEVQLRPVSPKRGRRHRSSHSGTGF